MSEPESKTPRTDEAAMTGSLAIMRKRSEQLELELYAEIKHRQRWAPAITAALAAAGIQTDTGDLEECVRGIERLAALAKAR